MRRILLAALVLLLAVPAAADDRVWRIGFLTAGGSYLGSVRSATMRALAENGYHEGKNLELVARWANGEPDRLPALARELAAAKVDVIIAVSNAAIGAAKAAAPDTPIVMSFAGRDPLEDGFVQSYARPGGRVTGIVMLAPELTEKRIQILREALPAARRIGFLAAETTAPAQIEETRRAAAALGLSLAVATARGPAEFSAAFAKLRVDGADGVVVASHPFFSAEGARLAAAAIEHRFVTSCEWGFMARDGCTFGYGADLSKLRYRTGEYVARILRGADPAELPLEQPDRFEFVVNLRTAAALGLELPPGFLLRADEVIE